MTALPAVPAPGRPQRDHLTGESATRAPARLAAEIRRIRQQLTSHDMLNNPRVSTELNELYKQVIAELDQHQGRHRLSAGAATAPAITQATAPRRRPGPRAIGEPVPDASGLNLKPDPLTASTGAELVGVLRRYRQWAGDPSLRDMAAQSGQQVAHSTMYVALKRTSLPKLRVVLAIVAGCGGSQDDQRAFASAWRQVKSGNPGAPPGARKPVGAHPASQGTSPGVPPDAMPCRAAPPGTTPAA